MPFLFFNPAFDLWWKLIKKYWTQKVKNKFIASTHLIQKSMFLMFNFNRVQHLAALFQPFYAFRGCFQQFLSIPWHTTFLSASALRIWEDNSSIVSVLYSEIFPVLWLWLMLELFTSNINFICQQLNWLHVKFWKCIWHMR